MDIKLTNGKKIITRSKIQYEANINNYIRKGFKLVSDIVKEVKETTNDKVVKLKPKKSKKGKK